MEEHKRIKAKAIRLLSRKEYSVSNLRRKLLEFASLFSPTIPEETVKLVINELIMNNLVSDQRAVESLINQKISRCGKMKLRMELNKLEVSKELLENTLNKIESSEYQRAFELLIKKYKQAPLDQKGIVSQKNFLIRRGFHFEICGKAVDDRLSQLK